MAVTEPVTAVETAIAPPPRVPDAPRQARSAPARKARRAAPASPRPLELLLMEAREIIKMSRFALAVSLVLSQNAQLGAFLPQPARALGRYGRSGEMDDLQRRQVGERFE